jgi:magnesium and cobalt transporter
VKHPAGVEFEVLDADPRRLKRLRVRVTKPAEQAAGVSDANVSESAKPMAAVNG